MLFFILKKKARKWQKPVHGEDVIMENVCQKFQSRNYPRQDAPHSGQPTGINRNKMKELANTNLRYMTRIITDIFQILVLSVKNPSTSTWLC